MGATTKVKGFESDISVLASYHLANFRTGIVRDSWSVDFYVNHLNDERAEIYVQPRNYEPTVVTNRPRTY